MHHINPEGGIILKKGLAFFCVLAMLMAFTVPALGEKTEPTLEEVTLRVKQALDIADDYTDFTSDSYNGTWNLNWTGTDRSVYVTCSSEGEILSYSIYDNNDSYKYNYDYVPRFPTAGTDSVKEATEDFLARVTNEGKSWTLDEVSEGLENDNTTSAYVSGRLVIGKYPTDVTFNVTIDLTDMRVTNYYRSDSYMQFVGEDFDETVNISEEEARALLKEKSALTLQYYIVNEDDMAKLCYIRDYNGTFIVRAADGEVVNLDELYTESEGEGYATDMSAGKGDGATSEVRQLTEAELAGISVYENALSANELDEKARAFTEFGLTDDYLLTSVDYYNGGDGLLASLTYARKIPDDELASRYGMSEDAIASIGENKGYYDTKNISLTASTGALDSMYTSHPYIYGTYKADTDTDAHRSTADGFIQKYFPEIYASIELSAQNHYANPYYYASTVNYYYVRMYNAYKFNQNYVNVSVNPDDGTIDSFYMYWDDTQEFEEQIAEDLVTEEAAYETYSSAFPFELALVSVPQSDGTYAYNYTYERTLAWHYADSYDVYGVDATTGELLRYAYSTEGSTYGYSDIEGIPQQSAIERLAQYGVGFSGGAFMPEQALTARDMLSLLLMAGGNTDVENMTYEDICSTAMQFGAPDFSEIAPDAVMTKIQFAGLIVDMYGFGDVAGFTDIYNCGFADDAKIAGAYYSHVALAYGMGLIEPDEENNINAAAELTRAEGAQILYNFLSRAF